MMQSMLRTVVCLSLVAAGCVSPGPYVCATVEDCGAGGSCAPATDGRTYCAAADAECPSGQRFGDSAGAQAGQCTGVGRLGGDECFVGGPLDAARSTCIAEVCEAMAACCAVSWGPGCVQAAEVRCDAACGGRVVFTRDRLTNTDHSQVLQDGAVEVWDFAPGSTSGTLVATPVPTGISGPQAYWTAAWVDVERDRDPELFVGTFDGYVGGDHQRLWHPTSASWEVAVDLGAIGGLRNVIDVGFGDTNRDGLVDLTVTGDSTLILFAGVDTGDRFAPAEPAVPDLPESSPLPSGLDLGDFDRDGDDDLVYLDYRNDLGRVVERGEAGFTFRPSFATAPVTGDAAFGDVDNDGDLDVLLADGAGALLLRNDDGVLPPVWNHPTGPRKGTFYNTAVWIDVDADLDLDVVVGRNETGRLTLIENVGGVLADAVLWISPIELAGEIEGIAVGDVDGDGDLDLAVAGGDSPSRIWLNDGDRTFTPGWVDGSFRRHRRAAMTARPAPRP